MDKTLEKLAATLPELPPHLRRAGRHILAHLLVVALLSLRTLAAKAKVNPPTMLRLVRRIGFDSYEAFRAVFQRAIAGGRFESKAVSLQEMRGRTGHAGVIGGIAAGALHFMGVNLQYLSRAVLPNLRVPRANFNSLSEAMVGVGKGDVVLVTSVAPYALQTVKATELAKARGARVVALTDSRGSPLVAHSEIVLIAGTDSPQFYPSMVGSAAVLETLVALVIAKGDPATLARIAEIDRLRHEEHNYIDFAPET